MEIFFVQVVRCTNAKWRGIGWYTGAWVCYHGGHRAVAAIVDATIFMSRAEAEAAVKRSHSDYAPVQVRVVSFQMR